eukprot:768635-Hanusia_phi.AAC.14
MTTSECAECGQPSPVTGRLTRHRPATATERLNSNLIFSIYTPLPASIPYRSSALSPARPCVLLLPLPSLFAGL